MWYKAKPAYRRLPVALQSVLVDLYGRVIRRQRLGPEGKALERFLEESEYWEPERLRAYQEERLREIVRHAYETVPYYRETMDERGIKPSDVSSVEDLRKFPVLQKSDVATIGSKLRSTAVPRSSLWSAPTSATTGSPLWLYRDRPVSLMNHACYMRLRRWAGFPFGTPYATIQGMLVAAEKQSRPPYWRHNRSWNQLLFSTLHLSDKNIGMYVDKIREFGARAIEAYPSCAFIIASYLEGHDEYLSLDAVTTSGEPLLPTERRVIEERFKTRVFDAYSSAERVVFSSECEEHDGHHLYAEFGITEIVDEDGNPQPYGSPGLIVGTSLHNMGTPMIRYACGDVGVLADRRCACGRTLPMMEGLSSRVGDVVVTKNGRMIPTVMLSFLVKEVPDVKQWQLVQESLSDFRVKLVRETPLTERDRGKMLEFLRRRVGPDVRVRFELVDEIPSSRQGKIRHIISDVPLVWGSPNRWSGGDHTESRVPAPGSRPPTPAA